MNINKENLIAAMIDGFRSALIEDMQLTENDYAYEDEREAIEVEDVSPSCEAKIIGRMSGFINAIDSNAMAKFMTLWLHHYTGEELGYNVYLEAVGHGVGVWDKQLEGDKDYAAVNWFSELIKDHFLHEEFYIGDDKLIYWD